MAEQKKIITVEATDAGRLDVIAKLHLKLFSFGPMSPFGERFVRILGYELPIRDGLMQLACMEIEGVIVGFIAYTVDAKGFYAAALKNHWLRVLAMTISSIIAKPSRLGAALRAARVARERSSAKDVPEEGMAEITAIAVLPEYGGAEYARRTGIRVSSELIAHAKSDVKHLGARQLRGVIDGFNRPAVMMFGLSGATVTPFEQAGEPMYSIVFDLD